MNSVITLVRTFAITPAKKDTNRINSREELYKVAEILQERIDNSSGDERDDLQIQHARISSVIRTYEEIVEGNYIDNLIRAEREKQAAIKRDAEQENTQTTNLKPKKFGRH